MVKVRQELVRVLTHAAYLLSGGQDSLIQAWPISDELEASPKVKFTLIGHQRNVCTIDSDSSGRIVSGSWDMCVRLPLGKLKAHAHRTAKIWRNFELVHTLEGHEQAVWAVVALDPSPATNGEPATLTGSADKNIRLFVGDKPAKPTRVFKGHDQPVRSLARHPNPENETFVSCGNDGSVRLWSLSGDQLAQLAGHDSFVYSLSILPGGAGLVSGGEDRSVRIWRESDGECEQTIVLPAISVWAVTTLANGDVAAGTNDGAVRVFSREPGRHADAATLTDYEDSVSNSTINSQTIGDVKKSDLPGNEALLQPGKKEGQVIMVKQGDKVEAHQWSTSTGTWTKIGEVVDGVKNSQKQLHNGQEYDYVFDIDLGDGRPFIKLPYNLSRA